MTYEGWSNYETWTVNILVEQDYSFNQMKIITFRNCEKINPSMVEKFCKQLIINCPDWDKVNWAEIAEEWEIDIKEYKNYE